VQIPNFFLACFFRASLRVFLFALSLGLLGLSLCGPISQNSHCCGQSVILARFLKFCCRASAGSACELFAMTGCSGNILKMRKMTEAKKELELQTGRDNVKDIHVVHKSEHSMHNSKQHTNDVARECSLCDFFFVSFWAQFEPLGTHCLFLWSGGWVLSRRHPLSPHKLFLTVVSGSTAGTVLFFF